jgi:hypothetical protein
MTKLATLSILIAYFFFCNINYFIAQNKIIQGLKRDTIEEKEIKNLISSYGNSPTIKKVVDLDNDGNIEVIVITSGGSFSNSWYIIGKDSIKNTFKQIWSSPTYANERVADIGVFDLNNDGNLNIIVGYERGTFEIYDAKTRTLLRKSINTVPDGINRFLFEDADNDGEKDIVVLGNYYYIYVLDPITFSERYKISKNSYSFRIGNIDDDKENEIVLSNGTIYELKGIELKEQKPFKTDANGILELSDVDGDGKKEIVFLSNQVEIEVYDADVITKKFSLSLSSGIGTIHIKDMNADGVDDIIYGGRQGEGIFCFDPIQRKQIWKVFPSGYRNNSGFAIADIDNDKKDDIIFGGDFSSLVIKSIYMYNIENKNLIWSSHDIVGPFNAMEYGDIDGDNKPEIVIISKDLNYVGGNYNKIIVLDGETYKEKWISSGSFLGNTWGDIYTLSIKDLDNDGVNEIIIAASELYDGKVWIIDGKNHIIKFSKNFSGVGAKLFKGLVVEDIDNDNKLEIIIGDKKGVYIVEPNTWNIKKTIAVGENWIDINSLRCTDLNGDGMKEIIILKNDLYIIDGKDNKIWNANTVNLSNIDLYDYNKDGFMDVVACSQLGYIRIYSGKNREQIYFSSATPFEMTNIKVMDYEGSTLFIYTSQGRLNYYFDELNHSTGKYLGEYVGSFESLKLLKNGIKSNILLGTPNGVLLISANDLSCAGMHAKQELTEVSCDKIDGKIKLNIIGGKQPYEINWSNGSMLDSLENINEGKYVVKIKDKEGCVKNRIFELKKSYIDVDYNIKDAGCDTKGRIELKLNHINSPYQINWSNGVKGLINDSLTSGIYILNLRDSKGCKLDKQITIKQKKLSMGSSSNYIECNGQKTGYIGISIFEGTPPYKYNWINRNDTTPTIKDLKAGQYIVSVSDASGCYSILSTSINEADKFAFKAQKTPDISGTPLWEGKVIISNINGGFPPYTIYWPALNYYGNIINNVPSDTYQFQITDSKNCTLIDSIKIEAIVATDDYYRNDGFLINPNPNKGSFSIMLNIEEDLIYSYQISDINGRLIKEKLNITNRKEDVIIENISNNLIFVKIIYNNRTVLKKVLLE